MSKRTKLLGAAGFILAMATPAVAGDRVPLVPFNSPLLFAPHMPVVVKPDHPFAGRVRLDPIADMPERVGSFLNTFVRVKEMNAALADTLAASGMQARDPQSAPYHLAVTWLTFESPFKIGTSSRAKATLRYELRRTGSEEVIFRRDVTSAAEASGGDASARQRGTVRATLSANLAAAMWCMEQSPLGKAPAVCTATPVGSFGAPVPVAIPVPVYRR